MKKIYRPLLKGTNWALAGLMTLIGGVVSCDALGGDEPCMYGTPHATYNIKGKVTDGAGTAIPGIEVKAVEDWRRERADYPEYPGKTLTDAAGEYALTLHAIGKNDFTVYATDIDGEANGSWQKDSVAVAESTIEMTGKKGTWEDGTGSATVHFKLKEEINKEVN